MAEDFEAAVEEGLRLSRRLFFGNDRAADPPKHPPAMERSGPYLPTSPMIYAVISDPKMVDNPDMASYQPYVHGRCDPPALIPLQMNGISLEVDCFLETAFVTVSGAWRVHCVMGSCSCDCLIAFPMGEQGSVLGVEIEVPNKSYSTQLIAKDNENSKGKTTTNLEDGAFLKPHIFTLTVPKVDGGSNISVKLRWSQKLAYRDGEFTLSIPFKFPEYVIPAGKKIPKHEKIELNVKTGTGIDILSTTSSHPLKEQFWEAGKSGFFYNSDVLCWPSTDFVFTYRISPIDTNGIVLLSPAYLQDVDRREMFCCYLFPTKKHSEEVFRKEVIFVVDISGSMVGKPLEDTKKALISELAKLDPEDSFNVIAFNDESRLFSPSMEPATGTAVDSASQWIALNFVASGGTNILQPLNQAIETLSDSRNSIPIIFLITDGAVEDERLICDTVKSQLADRKHTSPRIYTLGIGVFCNHYFLRMLSTLGRGHHEAAIDVDSIDVQVGRLCARASSIVLADIAFENLDEVDDLEVYPSRIPDLSSESPLVVSGRYRGTFPKTLKVKGILPDVSTFTLNLKVQDANEIPIRKMLAKQEIDLLTAEAWHSDNRELRDKIANISVQNATTSEYTDAILLESERRKINADPAIKNKLSSKADHQKTKDSRPPKIILTLHNVVPGFGNLTATAANIPSGSGEAKLLNPAEVFAKGASNCCGKLFDCCCCMRCIQTCSRTNDQFVILLVQLCGSLACLGCYACCCAEDGR